MSARRLFVFLLLFIALKLPLFATFHLNRQEIRKVMSELFQYHIDKKEISPLILERSLKIYLENFDSERIYLLDSEAKTYTNPHPHLLNKMLQEYHSDLYSTYFEVNQTLKNSILRARGWRAEWMKEPKKLIEEARVLSSEKYKTKKTFSGDLSELKERYRHFILTHMSLELKILNSDALVGKEAEFVALCDKRIVAIENPYLGFDEEGREMTLAEKEHLIYLRTIKSLAHSLDAHTAYYSPDEAFSMRVQLEKGMCGIGVVLHEGIEGVAISEVIKGGPAEVTGALKIGDVIVDIEGQSVKKYSFKKVLDVLRGEEGTKLHLGILRRNERSAAPVYQKIELTRTKITIEDKRVDVSYEPYADGILGKITLYSFYEGDDGVSSEKDVRKAILDLKKKGHLYGLVLDLRENNGGFLSQSVRVSSLFISSGIVVISKYFDGTLKFYRAVEGSRLYDGPLVVLISKGSASATEIVAQTLQDYGVAVVVGDHQTYGKGSIQHQTITNGDKDSSFFKVTIGKYYTVSGRSTQIEGVKADIVVPTELNFQDVGEGHLDFPLPTDHISSYFQDNLNDLDPYAKKWFAKYYLPNLQPKLNYLQPMITILKENSLQRLNGNKNFQEFLKKARKEISKDEANFGSNDLQMEESVNILKDMIFLQNH